VPEQRNCAAMAAAGNVVAARIKSSARNTGQDAQFLFRRFAIERLLVRLDRTVHTGNWCLKGGLLMLVLGGDFRRPTEDLDVTTLSPFESEALVDTFRLVAATPPPEEDGLSYAVDTEGCYPMREEAANPGLRVALDVLLHTSTSAVQIRIKVDAAHGEAITPGPRPARLPPTCKGYEPPWVPVYPWETVVAEKLHAITKHGRHNTRVKDFYDLVAISRQVRFGGAELSAAVLATFTRRGYSYVQAEPFGLADEFAASREADWARFMTVKGLGASIGSMAEAVAEVRAFAGPMLACLAEGRPVPWDWTPGAGWCPAPVPEAMEDDVPAAEDAGLQCGPGRF